MGLVLPAAAPEEQVSGSVVTDPDDYARLPGLHVIDFYIDLPYFQEEGPSLRGMEVDIGGNKTQPADRPFTFTTPPDDQPQLSFQISGQPRIAIAMGKTFQFKKSKAVRTPPIALAGGLTVTHAPVKGDARLTQIYVGNRRARIIAERPGAVFWIVPPDTLPGKSTAVLSDENVKLSFPLFVLGLKVVGDGRKTYRGDSLPFRVSLTGLHDLKEDMWWRSGISPDLVNPNDIAQRAPNFHVPRPYEGAKILLTVETPSPDVIDLPEGRNNVIALSLGQHDFRNGDFSYAAVAHSKASGEFRLKVEPIFFLRKPCKNGRNLTGVLSAITTLNRIIPRFLRQSLRILSFHIRKPKKQFGSGAPLTELR